MESFTDFDDEYQDRVDDVLRSDFRSFSLRLSDWLDLLDNSPFSGSPVRRLEAGFDFAEWYNAALTTRGGMVGSGNLNWARDRI